MHVVAGINIPGTMTVRIITFSSELTNVRPYSIKWSVKKFKCAVRVLGWSQPSESKLYYIIFISSNNVNLRRKIQNINLKEVKLHLITKPGAPIKGV